MVQRLLVMGSLAAKPCLLLPFPLFNSSRRLRYRPYRKCLIGQKAKELDNCRLSTSHVVNYLLKPLDDIPVCSGNMFYVVKDRSRELWWSHHLPCGQQYNLGVSKLATPLNHLLAQPKKSRHCSISICWKTYHRIIAAPTHLPSSPELFNAFQAF